MKTQMGMQAVNPEVQGAESEPKPEESKPPSHSGVRAKASPVPTAYRISEPGHDDHVRVTSIPPAPKRAKGPWPG